MGDLLHSIVQFVMTWSAFVGVPAAIAAMVCLLVGSLSPRRRVGAARWALLLLWPFVVYLWTAGVVVSIGTFNAWGWLAAVPLLVLMFVFGSSAAWAGIVCAFVSGRWDFVLMLGVVYAVTMALKMGAFWMHANADPPPFAAAGEVSA